MLVIIDTEPLTLSIKWRCWCPWYWYHECGLLVLQVGPIILEVETGQDVRSHPIRRIKG